MFELSDFLLSYFSVVLISFSDREQDRTQCGRLWPVFSCYFSSAAINQTRGTISALQTKLFSNHSALQKAKSSC